MLEKQETEKESSNNVDQLGTTQNKQKDLQEEVSKHLNDLPSDKLDIQEVLKHLNDLPSDQRDSITHQLIAVAVRGPISKTFRGPIPDPRTLAEYKDLDPSFPDRIFQMAEKNSARAEKINHDRHKEAIYRLNLGFIYAISALIATVFLACNGHDGAAIAMATTSIVGGIGSFCSSAITSTKGKDNKEDNN